jgi:hypothetical protein
MALMLADAGQAIADLALLRDQGEIGNARSQSLATRTPRPL